LQKVLVSKVHFTSANFFFSVVRRYSVEFASSHGGKSLAGQRFVRGGGAILSEFRPGGGTETSMSEALFVTSSFLAPFSFVVSSS